MVGSSWSTADRTWEPTRVAEGERVGSREERGRGMDKSMTWWNGDKTAGEKTRVIQI